MIATVVMVLASTSSSPFASFLLALGGLVMWPHRRWLGVARWAALGAYLSAGVLMTRPAYYLMEKADFTGSSTGWYRARLIESSIEHLSEWWAFGTDNTGHWMANPIDSRHADITNYYLYIGTIGGLLAVILMVAVLWRAFTYVGAAIRDESVPLQHRFMIWCLGVGLFAHAATSLAVTYFDQSMTFFWLNLGFISAMFSAVTRGAAERPAVAAAQVDVSKKTIPANRARPAMVPFGRHRSRAR
jgi:hypothetical protein